MFRVLRRKTVIAVGVLALASFAGGAVAATQETSNPRAAFLSDLAARLHVTVPQLTSAIKGADLDALNRAVASGHLTTADAAAIRRRIVRGEAVPLGGLISAPGYARPRMFGGPFRHGIGGGGLRSFAIVLGYLRVTPAKLLSELRGGKSLAQVATSNGKTIGGLEHAIIAADRARLRRLVAARLITRANADKRLARLEGIVPKIVTSADPVVEGVDVMPGRVLMGGSER
jgi:hypothetical protein